MQKEYMQTAAQCQEQSHRISVSILIVQNI